LLWENTGLHDNQINGLCPSKIFRLAMDVMS